ncbi:hypothetical protein [Bacteroides uniformis]|uniref:hypothetical protein n=1 Tax=Bacteroides uniformis TaxID=820 RepID=UPI003F522372
MGTVRKGSHTGITAWYQAGDDFVTKSQKRFFFPDGKLPHLKETVYGWRTKRPALCGLNTRSLHMCVIEREI